MFENQQPRAHFTYNGVCGHVTQLMLRDQKWQFQEGKTCTWHTVNTTSGSKELCNDQVFSWSRLVRQWSLGHP